MDLPRSAVNPAVVTRGDTRVETITPPDLQGLGALGRPEILAVAGMADPDVPIIAMSQ